MRNIGFVVRRFIGYILFCGDAMERLDSCTLGRGERGEISGVVVGMVPDGTRGRGGSIDEELVVLLGIILSDPARRQFAMFVFHGTT